MQEITFGIPKKGKRKINGSNNGNAKTDLTKTLKIKSHYTAKELFELNIKELPMLVDNLFIKSGLAIFSGSSDTGKSTFLRQLGLSIAKGDKKFLEWDIKAIHNKVIYISTEDDKIATSYLLNKSLNEESDTEYLKNFTYIFETKDLVKKLDEMLKNNPADCIIIDALTDLYGADLNQSNKVRNFLNAYFDLANKYNCLVIFLHHTGKGKEEAIPNKNNLLGSQGIEGKARQVIELRRDPSDNKYRHLCIVKGNYFSDDMKEKSFKLKFNSDLTFSSTGERTKFNELILVKDSQRDYYEKMIPRIVELRESENMTFEKITTQLNDEGFKIGKTKVNELYNEAKK